MSYMFDRMKDNPAGLSTEEKDLVLTTAEFITKEREGGEQTTTPPAGGEQTTPPEVPLQT